MDRADSVSFVSHFFKVREHDMAMSRDEAHAALDEVDKDMARQHKAQPERLHQFASAVKTARMAIDHLFDHAENAAADEEG